MTIEQEVRELRKAEPSLNTRDLIAAMTARGHRTWDDEVLMQMARADVPEAEVPSWVATARNTNWVPDAPT